MPLAVRTVEEAILEPKRGVWTERLLWMALWARARQATPPVPWRSFLVVADALQQGTPPGVIPPMEAVAVRTVQSAIQRAQAR